MLRTIVCIAMLGSLCACQPATETRTSISETVPRSDQAFLDDPDNFQFVIVGDRTGGHRPGVFETALDRVNLMQPEFVISVGDQIEGYTDDPVKVNAEWAEFEGFIESLDMPFFCGRQS